MSPCLIDFDQNIRRAKDLIGFYRYLRNNIKTHAVDVEDILRASLVIAVSALDEYVHGITRNCMLETFTGKRQPTRAYISFRVSLEGVAKCIANPTQIDWLDLEIRERHQWQSFQRAEKIADAIRLVSEIPLWDQIGSSMNKTSQQVRQEIDLIIDRRNKIVHEADTNPTIPGTRWPIDEKLVRDSHKTIGKVAHAIDSLV